MDNNQTPFEPLQTYPARTPKRSKSWAKLAAIVVVLIIVILGAKSLFFSQKQAEVTTPPTPTPTEFQFPTDTPFPSQGVTPTPSVSPTPNAVDSKTGLDRSSVTVEVLNGSGTVGAASKASDILKGLGYDVASTGNADNFNYDTTEVHVKATKSKFAVLVKSDLDSSYTISVASSDLPATASADIEVIVGKQ